MTLDDDVDVKVDNVRLAELLLVFIVVDVVAIVVVVAVLGLL